MSFDSFIGAKRIVKFSPILNLYDFRCNAIYAKNLLKLSFPSCDEDDLNNSHPNDEVVEEQICGKEEEGLKDIFDNKIENTSENNTLNDERCLSALSCEDKLNTSNEFQVAANKLVKLTSNKAPPGEIETKYKERLNKPGEEMFINILNYNKPTIDEAANEKYSKGFLNIVNYWKGDISEAVEAVRNVQLYTDECIKQIPVYSNTQLFGGVHTHKDKFSYEISNRRMKTFRENMNLKKNYINKAKYFNFEEYAFDTRTNHLVDEIPNEIRLTVRIYMPKIKKDLRLPYNFNAGYPVIDKVFFFCGNNTLKQLKDKMLCYWDLVCVKREEEGTPSYTDFMMYKVPSSFFFIHDTFYIDKSRPNLKDIKEEYREFLEKRPHLFGASKVADMDNTKLIDLNLRLGMGYVYVHMGGHCEHMFSISDVRMITYNDYHNLKTYPIRILQPLRKKKCWVCSNYGPRYIVVESKLLPKCPKLMCEKCYKTFNYTLSIKNSDSLVYPYVDRNLIV